jgi:hypothetical protein
MGQWMSDALRPPPKKEVALFLLEEEFSMFIHLDPRRPHVVVPRGFMGQSQLILQVGRRMAIPIPDLTVDDEGISCTLSFNRSPFWCRIPWSAIYALIGEDGRGGVWPEDVPPEIQHQHGAAPPKGKEGRKAKPKLAAVSGDGQTPGRARETTRSVPPGGQLTLRSVPPSDVPAADEAETHNPPATLGDTPDPAVEATLAAAPGDAPESAGDALQVSKAPSDPPRRPRLVAAVPDPAPEQAPDEAGPGEEAQPAGPSQGTKKTKREIPPYLRVIK